MKVHNKVGRMDLTHLPNFTKPFEGVGARESQSRIQEKNGTEKSAFHDFFPMFFFLAILLHRPHRLDTGHVYIQMQS